MQLHQIKRNNPNKKSIRIGRGGKRGKTAGRGTKGQNARAGHRKRPEIRDLIKKLPKKRGYRFKSFQDKPVVINLSVLEANFADKAVVTPAELVKKALIRNKRGTAPMVKILSNGILTKKIIMSGCLFSNSTKEKIEKAGGKIK